MPIIPISEELEKTNYKIQISNKSQITISKSMSLTEENFILGESIAIAIEIDKHGNGIYSDPDSDSDSDPDRAVFRPPKD